MLTQFSAGLVLVTATCVLVLGACGGTGTMVVFRDLADIPERPDVTARAVNNQAIEALQQDRARTEEAAENLRAQPFTTPEPAPTRPAP